MAVLEGTIDYWLEQGTAIRTIYERAEPYLVFTQFVDPIQEQDNSFIYQKDDTGISGDAKKEKPAHVKIGGNFPEVDLSRGTVTPGLTESRGFSVRIKHEQIRKEPRGINEIQRAYRFAGYWMAQHINDAIATAITTGATTPTWTPTSVWSTTATATPITDMIAFKNTMKREGYPYRMTDIFAYMTSLNELEAFLLASEIPAFRESAMNGMNDSIVLPIEGKPVFHGLFSGISDGYVLGIDRENPPAEYHYYVDPKFGTETVTYNTILEGREQSVTAANLGINVDTYEEQGSHDQIIKFWCESKTVVTKPYAAQYDNGI